MTMPLSDAAVAALRTIYEHGDDGDRARARDILAAHGLVDDPAGRVRAELRAGGPMLLGERLMPGTVYGARSPLHDFINTWHLHEAANTPGRRDAVAAPRGHGKSTAAVELGALFHAAYCTRPFQVIVSDTYEQARGRVQAIKAQAEANDDLRELFPRLRPAFGYGAAGTWRENDLVFACGCRIVGYGAGTAIRGMKHRDERPTMLYLDDLEDEDSVATPYQIDKRLKWLTRSALALGSPIRGMSVLWVGTILSRDALLNLATGAALDEGQTRPSWAQAWTPTVYRAEVDGTPRLPVTVDVEDPVTHATFTITRDVGEPMWSELSREKLARIRGEIGDAAYAAEYMADPVDGQGGMLAAPTPVSFVNPDAPPRARVVRTSTGVVPVAAMQVATALDPQFALPGESTDPDLAAVVTVGQYGARTFILDAWIGRDRDGQAGRAVAQALAWGSFVVGVEKNAAQVLVVDQAAQLAQVPVRGLQSTEGKAVRALPLSVRLSQGRVFALSSSGQVGELTGYLTAFPHGRYKDPVDAVVMAVGLAAAGASVDVGGGGPAAAGK